MDGEVIARLQPGVVAGDRDAVDPVRGQCAPAERRHRLVAGPTGGPANPEITG